MCSLYRAKEELAERAERASARVGNSRLDAGIDSAKARLAKVMGLKVNGRAFVLGLHIGPEKANTGP